MTEGTTIWSPSAQDEEEHETTHFVFSSSGAGTLGMVLREAGIGDPVIACGDDYSFGPIDPPDPAPRGEWVAKYAPLLVATYGEWPLPMTEEFWDAAVSAEGRRVVWVSRSNVMEYSGFLEWVWRFGSEPYDVVDITDVEACWQEADGTVSRMKMEGLGMINPDHLDMVGLLDQAKPLPLVRRALYRELWRQLRAENASLRILDADKLVSVPISHFDELLLSLATDRWRKVLRLIGDLITKTNVSFARDVSHDVLHGRIWALVDDGRLEAWRDPENRWGGWVRMRQAQA